MQRDFSLVKGHHFDVLVCGGGIYGAWTAYDAALRGLSVAVVDQGDWACATSSASSKLIHGGLRYLESFDFKLVRKTLAERQMLLQTAAHRIWPIRFGLPVYRDSRLGSLRLSIGLALYDRLAGAIPAERRFHRYSAADFTERFPFLNTSGLLAGYTYFDAQTDDARLVLELIAGAQRNGAVCVNYCKVSELTESNGRLNGAYIRDQVTGETANLYASQIVNTTGQWSSLIQNESPSYRLSKGVHLVLPKMVENEALLLTAKSDGRVFFIMPWYGLTLVGTTDSNYVGDINQIKVDPEEREYLLTEVNRVVKNAPLKVKDVIGQFAGLRVLKMSTQESPSAISRDWELKSSKNGLLTSIGGKLTSARADAECIVDRVCGNLGMNRAGSTFGKPFPWRPEGDYQQWARQQLSMAFKLGIDSDSAHWLLRRHGNRVGEIFHLCEKQPDLTERVLPEVPFILADLVFCARTEMVVHLEDLLRRRMPLLILSKITPYRLQQLAGLAARELNWDNERQHAEYSNCKQKWLGR
ncbi:MAG: FAD-dependent oxidoreductase [Methylosarcina sp.]